MKKFNIKFFYIIIMCYKKLIKVNFLAYVLYLFKIKNYIKILIYVIVLLANYSEFTSIWDLGDLYLKIVEDASSQASNNIKGAENNSDDNTFQIVELLQKTKEEEEKVSEEIDFDAMKFEEWLEYLRINEPKYFYGLLLLFTMTTIFCIWLMFKIIGPAFPPKEPPCYR